MLNVTKPFKSISISPTVVSLHTELRNVRSVQERTFTLSTGVYAEYYEKCTQSISTGNVHGVQDCISVYTKYKLSMSYDTESP